MTANRCQVYISGLVPYQKAWDLQGKLAGEVAAGTRSPTLLLLEHPHTITFGRRGHPENLLWDEQELARRGVTVYWVDRGGDVTYHGPGQLVGYPILPLAPGGLHPDPASGKPRLPQADFIGYLRKLEKVLIKTLAAFGIIAGQRQGLTGVWVQPDVASRCKHCPPEARKVPSKIAAIGVKVDAQGISRHGFALNVCPDMSYWQGIIGCGLEGFPAIRMADLLREPPGMPAVIRQVVQAFGEVFQFEMIVRNELLSPEDGESKRLVWV